MSVCLFLPPWSSYGKNTLRRLPVSGLQSVMITYTNTSRSIFSFMVIPMCCISQDLAHMFPISSHLAALRSRMNHDRTYFYTYMMLPPYFILIHLAHWPGPTLYRLGIKSEVNNRLHFKMLHVIQSHAGHLLIICCKIKTHVAKYLHTMTLIF